MAVQSGSKAGNLLYIPCANEFLINIMAVIPASFQKESQDRYLTYALSVVSGRALPDARDGLKPVQRRILYAMLANLNLRPNGSHKKCAKIVGEVLAQFHPHGDIACYEALVRMAQDFSLRYPLIDGQGNFGSLDGDSAAAYRYTEAKLAPAAIEVLGEIFEETVDFRNNFDASCLEPIVLPSRMPNLLVNGVTGIAVGMATSIPPHNLRDTVNALLLLLEDPEVSISKLVGEIKGPDFPTGCLVLNSKKELEEIYASGRGSVKMRGEWKAEKESRGKQMLIITSIPYTVNKAQLVEKIASLIIDKKIPQLLDIRDESTKDVRVVLEMRSEGDAENVMAYLYKNTPLELNFSVNLTALLPTAEGALIPAQASLKVLLQHFLDFRQVVVRKRLEFEKKNLLARIHILEGFEIIFDALDEAIKIVRKSDGRINAAENLRKRFKLTEIQSLAIVDLRIYQLSRTNIDEIRAELKEKRARLAEIEAILKSKTKVANLVKKDLQELLAEFGDTRRSKIIRDHVAEEIDEAAFVVKEEVFALVTSDGWIKRIRQNNELSATRLRDGDRILRAHPLNTLDKVVFFTNLGNVYSMNATDFPSSSGYGDPVQKHLKFKDGEKVIETFGWLSKDELGHQKDYPYYLNSKDSVCFVSRKGIGYATKLGEIDEIKRNGKRVMKTRDGDGLQAVCKLGSKLSVVTKNAYALSIPAKVVLERSAPAVGVCLVKVDKSDEVVGSFSDQGLVNLRMEGGSLKELSSKDVILGDRGYKVKKIGFRGQVLGVELNGQK